jgi:hypothetical protein
MSSRTKLIAFAAVFAVVFGGAALAGGAVRKLHKPLRARRTRDPALDRFDNEERLHEALGDVPPARYETINYRRDNTPMLSAT